MSEMLASDEAALRACLGRILSHVALWQWFGHRGQWIPRGKEGA
jgi:hypothetical protein